MRNTTNVIALVDRLQNCEECRLSGQCLVHVDGGETGEPHAGMPVSGHVIRRGTHIYRMGEAFDAVYAVRSGAVKTYRITEDGDQQVTGFYLPGDVFGLESVEADVYANSAVALDTSCICAFPYERLKSLCRDSSEVSGRLASKMSRRIRDGERTIMVLGHKSADERMAWFLIGLSEKQARLGLTPHELTLAMPRSDIGSYLMLAVETVSRVLTRLQNAGLINVDRHQVKIEDLEGLAEIAGSNPPTAGPEDRQSPARKSARA